MEHQQRQKKRRGFVGELADRYGTPTAAKQRGRRLIVVELVPSFGTHTAAKNINAQ